MTDLHDLERHGLSRRRRIRQALDRQAIAENNAAPEVSVAVLSRAAIGSDGLPVLRTEPQTARPDGEVPKVNAHGAAAGRGQLQAPQASGLGRLPRSLGGRLDASSREAQLERPLRQAAVDADDGRPALSRLQTLQIVGTQRRESDLGGRRKAQLQAGRPERLPALLAAMLICTFFGVRNFRLTLTIRRILARPTLSQAQPDNLPQLPTWRSGGFQVDIANREELYRVMEEE